MSNVKGMSGDPMTYPSWLGDIVDVWQQEGASAAYFEIAALLSEQESAEIDSTFPEDSGNDGNALIQFDGTEGFRLASLDVAALAELLLDGSTGESAAVEQVLTFDQDVNSGSATIAISFAPADAAGAVGDLIAEPSPAAFEGVVQGDMPAPTGDMTEAAAIIGAAVEAITTEFMMGYYQPTILTTDCGGPKVLVDPGPYFGG